MKENPEAAPKPNIHSGHRQRMQERFLRTGIDAFSDVEVLEYLLSFALPRIDTNPVAHRLLDRFGPLYRVFEAGIPQLIQVEGIGERAAALITFAASLWNRSEASRFRGEQYFHTTSDIGQFLLAMMSGFQEERASLMCLDAKCKLMDYRELSRGAVTHVNLPIRKVVETALAANACSVVLAHTHPAELLMPSVEDIAYTRELDATLKSVDVVLADHYIIAGKSYLSMRYSKLMEFLQ